MLESDIQHEILETLDKLGLFYWRSQTLAIRGRSNNKQSQKLKGMPDIMCLLPPHGTLVGLEVKTEDGKPSTEQLEWGRNLESNGGKFFIVRSVEDVLKALGE